MDYRPVKRVSGFSLWDDGIARVSASSTGVSMLFGTTAPARFHADSWNKIRIDVLVSRGYAVVYTNGEPAVKAPLLNGPRSDTALLASGRGHVELDNFRVEPYSPPAARTLVSGFQEVSTDTTCPVNRCYTFRAFDEDSVRVEVRDATGLPVAASFCEMPCGLIGPNPGKEFCGTATRTVTPGQVIRVALMSVASCGGIRATEGFVFATFAHAGVNPTTTGVHAQMIRYVTGTDRACVCDSPNVFSPTVDVAIPADASEVSLTVKDEVTASVAGWVRQVDATGKLKEFKSFCGGAWMMVQPGAVRMTIHLRTPEEGVQGCGPLGTVAAPTTGRAELIYR